MKAYIYTDVHFSTYSSIVRKRGREYSVRLENLIQSLNWAEIRATINNCDCVICLGDFFDKPSLTAEEISALAKVKWNNLPHYFLVGNHESGDIGLTYASTFALNNGNFTIINTPRVITIKDSSIYAIPYITENKKIRELFPDINNNIVISHNDIAGIQYGAFKSTSGFDLKDIEDNCSLFLNGHLHNCGFLNDKETILNVGNLTGQNFNEDINKYPHFGVVLDTSTNKLVFEENPFALNFGQLDVSNINALSTFLLKYKSKNLVLSVRCKEDIVEEVKENLKERNNVIEYRIIPYRDIIVIDDIDELTKCDHLKQFSEFVLTKIENTDILKEELLNVVGGKDVQY